MDLHRLQSSPNFVAFSSFTGHYFADNLGGQLEKMTKSRTSCAEKKQFQ